MKAIVPEEKTIVQKLSDPVVESAKKVPILLDEVIGLVRAVRKYVEGLK